MTSRAAGHTTTLRALHPTDAVDVRALFRATVAIGQPLALPEADLAAYESLCLGFYLEQDGSACAVLVEDGALAGYAMVALDHAAHERWARPVALRWAARAVRRMPLAPFAPTARFHRLRLLDGAVTLLRGPPAPLPAHFHFNVEGSRRGVRAGFALAAHADLVVGAAGLPGYFGEVNVPVSRPGREQALRRLGALPVHRQRNHTLSWLAGEPVDRLTVARRLDPAAGWFPLDGRAASG